jgi:FkbM family methyltransferase
MDLDGSIYEGHSGNYIDQEILINGAFDKPILFFLRDVMQSAYGNQGIFLDVGANTGQHSIFMARYAKQVHAVEPWEPVLKRLRRHVEINRLQNVIVHPFGLGSEYSKQPFFRPPETNHGTGSFVKEFWDANSAAGALEIRAGDDVFEQVGVARIGLIKMDIEGYEKPALIGLQRTLRQNRPVVEFELTTNPKTDVSVKSYEELVALFPNDYDFLTFSRDSDAKTGRYQLVPAKEHLRFDRWEQRDIVAYPAERKASIPLHGPKH